MDNLPEEILELILNYAEVDRPSLRACTSISRAFVPIAQRRFYSSIAFQSREDEPCSSSERLSQLAQILDISPHLLSYTTKIAYVVPTGIDDSDEVLLKEAEYLESIIPKMTSLQSISLGFSLGRSRWKPELARWDAIPEQLQRALRRLLALPELVEVHCQDIAGLPFDIIPWTSVTTLCLNNVGLNSSEPSHVTAAASSPTSLNIQPPRSNLALEDLVITVLPSPWIDPLVKLYCLHRLRRLVLSQADDSKYDLQYGEGDGFRVDYEAEHHAAVTLLKECEGSLEELYIYLPHYDPCSRPDQDPDSLQVRASPFDLSEHRNLKRLVKRMVWPLPDVVSPTGMPLKHVSGVGLDPTYITLSETLSTIKSEACKVVVEFNWREEPISLLEIGQGAGGFEAIDRAFASNPSVTLLVRHNLFCADIFHLADAKYDMDGWMEGAFPMLARQERFNSGDSRYRETVSTFEDFPTCSSGHCRELAQTRKWQEPERDDSDDDDYGFFSCRITL